MSHILFDEFLKELSHKPKLIQNPLIVKIEEFRDSVGFSENAIKSALDSLVRRAEEPSRVAITGQFSSGKSTFLNALLSKNILPTGITPVTSKINFIKYGEEFKLQVHYYDGREAFYGVENITSFTDQRGEVEQTDFLTLYAPLEILHDVTFVDTPGLNSQSHEDTKATEGVLAQVDGIIWLTLMDNAGKNSELEVLQKYMNNYGEKSLCVLNQKDKFSDEDIQKSLLHVKSSMGEYFADVVAISAREAMSARSMSKISQSEECLNELVKQMSSGEGLHVKVDEYLEKLEQIKQLDDSFYEELLRSSNIEQVLEFIYEKIAPASAQMKEYAINKELDSLKNRLHVQKEQIATAYSELVEILEEFETKAHQTFFTLKKSYADELSLSCSKMQNIIDLVASQIFQNIEKETRVRFESVKKGLMGKISYTPHSYEVAKINADKIYKILFYDDDLVGKMFKQYVKSLKLIQDSVNEQNEAIYRELEGSIKAWQAKYEVMKITDEIHCKEEAAKMRKFASSVYELFLKPFNDEIKSSYAKVSSEFNHLSSAVSFNYQNATGVSVAFLERKIGESIKLYEMEPTKFPLFAPKLEEIKTRLKENFYMYELENMMGKNSFLHKNYDRLMEQFLRIKAEKVEFLEGQKNNN